MIKTTVGNQRTWLPYLGMLAHLIFASFAFPMAKLGLKEVDPYVFAFFRFGFASLIYVPILIRLNKHQKIERKDNLKILLAGLIIIPFNQSSISEIGFPV